MAAASSNSESEWVVVGSNSDATNSDSKGLQEFGAESENGGGGNAATNKPAAWNKRSNGGVEIGSVMGGAGSWPALSESARGSPKSASNESLKILADGSLSAPQGTTSAPSSQVTTTNANATLTPNPVTPTRHKPTKRGGGTSSGGPLANGFPQPSPPHLEVPPNNSGKPSHTSGDSSSREHSRKETGQRGGAFRSQSPSSSDHQHQRNSFRRNNSFPHPRGDGSYNNYRGNQEWTSQRSFGRRDAHMQPPRNFPRGFVQQHPQHNSTPFIPPQPFPMPVRPFGNPMGYPEVPSPMIYVQGLPPDSLRGVPFVTPISPHAMFFPGPDPQLHSKIVNQIDYYFSDENLVKDTFLRKNMDEQGWVPVRLIAGFKKVTYLTDNIQVILDSVRSSTIVEVQGDRVRRQNDWMRWIMPADTTSSASASSSSQSLARSTPADMLAAQVPNITLG
ncbi:hypothetical protein LguiA_013942 [Lonicera macranthoides]